MTELLEGETLRDCLQQGAIPPRKAIDWSTQTARGLAAAHDKGIVHRDLKPENLAQRGQRAVVSPEYAALDGIAWSPTGDEVWFTSTTTGARQTLYGVKPGGPVREISSSPASLAIEDARADGTMLVQAGALRARLIAKTPAERLGR